ncbi:MAG: hypothetical protein ABNH38_18120 [Tateyamaria sp.]|jgi:hypothetical protein
MYSVLIYGFPLILVLFETALRYAFNLDTFGFLGPTLSSAAITSMVGNVKPKTQEISDAQGNTYLAVSKLDNQFVAFCLLVLFIMLLAWAISCYLSSISPVGPIVIGVQLQFLIGILTYILSVVLVAVKGVL